MIEIYYVEDDWAIAEAVKQYLEQKNIRVMRYATLAQAREALASHLPALVLLDWNMPDGQWRQSLSVDSPKLEGTAHYFFYSSGR